LAKVGCSSTTSGSGGSLSAAQESKQAKEGLEPEPPQDRSPSLTVVASIGDAASDDGEALGRLAALNFETGKPLRIREVETVLRVLLSLRSGTTRSQESMLGAIVSVGCGGDVAFFSPELLTSSYLGRGRVVAGNLGSETFEEIFEKLIVAEMAAGINARIEGCRTECEFFHFCGGGSPANKLYERGRFDVTETWYCRVAKQAAVRGVLKAVAEAQRFGSYALPATVPQKSQEVLT